MNSMVSLGNMQTNTPIKNVLKGSAITKALTCMKIYLYKQKWQFCQGDSDTLAILLYKQFIHYTKIKLGPNKQLLTTQQQAYQSFLSYFLL